MRNPKLACFAERVDDGQRFPSVRLPQTRASKKILRWGLRLALLVGSMLFVAVLLKEPILKALIERQLCQATGVKVRVGQVKSALTRGAVTLTDFSVFNPPGFGDGPLLSLAEFSCVLDTGQASKGRLHFNELRLRLTELNVIKNPNGLLNLLALKESILTNALAHRRGHLRLDFGGIDTLELTLGRFTYTDQRQAGNRIQYDLGVEKEVIKNLKTEQDLMGWLNTFLLRIAVQQYLQNPVGR